MAWGTQEVKDIIRRFGPVATLWFLAMIEKNIGTNKAHNYTVFPGKIKSLSKDYGMDLPGDDEISSAFDSLERSNIATPDGRVDTIIQGDKQEYVKLTDHGLTLITLIDNNPELQRFIREFLGDDSEVVDDWFPAPAPDDAPVRLRATSEQPSGDEMRYEVEAIAEFECPYPDCDGVISNSYAFIHPDDTWSRKIQVNCPACDEAWEFVAGDAFGEPTKPGQ